jgi:hypothetical protein
MIGASNGGFASWMEHEKSIQDFGGRNQKEGIFEDNINLDPDGGCRLYSCGSA